MRGISTDITAIARLIQKTRSSAVCSHTDLTQRIRSVTLDKTKPRPIILKLVWCADRKNEVCTIKKRLKISGISVIESFAASRMKCLNKKME